MTVLSGIFAVLAVYALTLLVARLDLRWRAAAFAFAIAVVAAPATLTTMAIALTGNDDTRVVVGRVRANLEGPLFTDSNTIIQSGWSNQSGERGWAFADRNRDWTNYRYLIVSDDVMGRFLRVDPTKGQKSFVARMTAGYQVVAELPAVQIVSAAGSFSHRNVSVRVVLLSDSPSHLDAIIARAPSVPTIEYRALPGVTVPPER